MARLKQETRVLKAKALASLGNALTAFNSPHDAGRVTMVLLNLQHAFEMLLKAALVQNGIKVFDRNLGRSLGIETCIGKAQGSAQIKLSEADAGTIRAVDSMRDDEQHWFNIVSEQMLYLHARAAVTLFDDILVRVFAESLAEYLPHRVLPVSADPPQDLQLLLDEEFSQIFCLLRPGRRAQYEARARIRTLLAMEAHVTDDVRVSSADVDRVVRAIKGGADRHAAFPRLESIRTTVDGEGLTVRVHFTKREGAPVRFVGDADIQAAGVRQIDLTKKYHRSVESLARELGLTQPRTLALRPTPRT